MLPNKSEIKLGLQHLIDERVAFKDNIKIFLESNLTAGDIDVNIMTKVDKDNFIKTSNCQRNLTPCFSSWFC
jgi:hypothetical protein